MIRRRYIAAAAASLVLSGAPAKAAPADYTIAAHFSLPQIGKVAALAVDTDRRRIYVAGSGGLDVINADDGSAAGKIAINGAVGGVVLAPDIGRGFASDRGRGSVVIFDLASGRTIKTVSVGRMPAALIFDPSTRRVFVASESGDSIAAIDASSGAVVGTAKLPGKPGQLEVNPYGSLYAAMPGTNKVAVVATGDVAFRGAIPVPNGDDCSGLALDPVGRRLFVGCANGAISVIDTDIGFAFENLAGAKGTSTATFVSRPDGKDGWKGAAIFANADGTITLVKMEAFIRYVAGGEVKVEPGLGPVAFDSRTHRIVVAATPSSGAPELLILSHWLRWRG